MADHSFDAELWESVLVLDVSPANDIGHDDVLVGHQEQGWVMATPIIELLDS